MKKTLPSFIVIFGVLFILFFVLADAIGLGKTGVQAARVVGFQAGSLIIVLGLILRSLQKKSRLSFHEFWLNLRSRLYNLPVLAWVALGTLPTYILFFMIPSFFNPTHDIQYPAGYIYRIAPVGIDSQLMLYALGTWLKSHQATQYIFAPVVHILFAPLLLLGYPASYYAVVLITLVSYLILALLSTLMVRPGNKAVIVFIAAISILSYGMVFEFERGQTYTFSFMLCLLAIYLFHWHPDFRWLAYLLVCVAVQIKYSPALFVLLFVDDWRDWKNTLLRFAGLGVVNFLLLFLFGIPYFSAFINNVTHSVKFGEALISNHSIYSFVHMLSSSEWHLLNGGAAQWTEQNSSWIRGFLYIYFILCFAVVLIGAWMQNKPGFNPNLLLACVIGGLVLPSINHDYSLPILTMPFALAVADWHQLERRTPFTIMLTVAAAFAYSAILIPHVFKPLFLWNALPLLFVILTVTTLQSWLPGKIQTEL